MTGLLEDSIQYLPGGTLPDIANGTATPTASSPATEAPAATLTPEPTETPVPTATITPVPTATPTMTATQVPTVTDTPTATATTVPSPSPTTAPTATAEPALFANRVTAIYQPGYIILAILDGPDTILLGPAGNVHVSVDFSDAVGFIDSAATSNTADSNLIRVAIPAGATIANVVVSGGIGLLVPSSSPF